MPMKFLSASSYKLPIVVSMVMHLGLVVVLGWGWQAAPHEPKVVTPKYIEAKLVQLKATTPKPLAAPKPQPKKIDVGAQRAEQERLKREQETKRQAELAKKQQAEKVQKEKERLAKEQAEREQKAKEQKLAEQQRMEDQLNDLLAEEDELIQAQQDEATAQSYSAVIRQRIQQNWSRPPSARNGMKCTLRIQLVPTGRVVNVSVVKGSGNAAFDRSAEQAVWKTEQFTELKDVESVVFEKYFREFTVLFEPQDLRL